MVSLIITPAVLLNDKFTCFQVGLRESSADWPWYVSKKSAIGSLAKYHPLNDAKAVGWMLYLGVTKHN